MEAMKLRLGQIYKRTVKILQTGKWHEALKYFVFHKKYK